MAAAAPATTVTVAPTVLLCCPRWLTTGSRVATPEGCQRAFARGTVPTPIRLITGRRSLAPSLLYPLLCQVILRLPLLPGAAGQRAYHVPQVEHAGGLGR